MNWDDIYHRVRPGPWIPAISEKKRGMSKDGKISNSDAVKKPHPTSALDDVTEEKDYEIDEEDEEDLAGFDGKNFSGNFFVASP